MAQSNVERSTMNLSLERMTPVDLDLLEASGNTEELAGSFQWFGFTDTRAIRRRFEEDGLLGPEGGVLVLVDGVDRVGRVEWFKSSWGRPTTSWCWTIAMGIRPDFRGRGFGSAGLELVVEYLFAHTRAERIQAWTDVQNTAAQKALVAGKFQQEGTLRAAQWRNGQFHDQLIYSRIRG